MRSGERGKDQAKDTAGVEHLFQFSRLIAVFREVESIEFKSKLASPQRERLGILFKVSPGPFLAGPYDEGEIALEAIRAQQAPTLNEGRHQRAGPIAELIGDGANA